MSHLKYGSDIKIDSSAFSGVLSVTDTDAQTALDTIDTHTHDGRYYTETEIDSQLSDLAAETVDNSLDSHRYPIASQDGDGSMVVRVSAPVLRDASGDLRGRAYPDLSRRVLENRGPLEFDLSDGSVNGIANGSLTGDWQSPAPFPVSDAEHSALGILEHDPESGITRAVKGAEKSTTGDYLLNITDLNQIAVASDWQTGCCSVKITNNTAYDRNITSLGIRCAGYDYSGATCTASVHSGGSGTEPETPDSGNLLATVTKWFGPWFPTATAKGTSHSFEVNIDLPAWTSVWITLVSNTYAVGVSYPSSPASFPCSWKYSSDGGSTWISSSYTNYFYATSTIMGYGAPIYPSATTGWVEVAKIGTPTYPIVGGGSITKLVERPYTEQSADSFVDSPASDEAPFATVPLPQHLIEDIADLQTELDGKSDTTHNHDSDYAPLSHSHAVADVTGLQAIIDDFEARIAALEP